MAAPVRRPGVAGDALPEKGLDGLVGDAQAGKGQSRPAKRARRSNRPIAEQQGTPISRSLSLLPNRKRRTSRIFRIGQSLCWRGALAVERGPIGRWNCRRTLRPRPFPGLLMFPWNQRSRWRGICAQFPVESAQHPLEDRAHDPVEYPLRAVSEAGHPEYASFARRRLALLWQIYSSDLRRVRLQCGHR